MATILNKEHIEVLKRDLGVNVNDYTHLELMYIDWLYFCSKRDLNPGWEGYYVWIHRPMPLKGYDYGLVESSVILDGKFKTLESIILYLVLEWNKWNPSGKEGWKKYWLNLLMLIQDQIKPIEQENYHRELIAWTIITTKFLHDFVYYVPVGLFEAGSKKNPVFASGSSSQNIKYAKCQESSSSFEDDYS